MPARNPNTTIRRELIVKSWNEGTKTMREVGEGFGVTREVVARSLNESRLLGMFVLAVNGKTRGERRWDAFRRNPNYQELVSRHAATMRAAKREKHANG